MTDLIPATSQDVSRMAFWAERIRTGLQRSVRAVVDAGVDLIDAKGELQHGEWLPMLELAGINDRTAQQLMQVARHPVLSDPRHASDLPASMSALAALARVDAEELEVAIEAGLVTPTLGREAARDLVRNAGQALASAMDDPDEGSTVDDRPDPTPAPVRFAEKRDEAVFSIEKGRLDDATAIITEPGFRLTVEVAQDLLRALRPLEDSRSRLLQALEDEVGYLIPMPTFDAPRRVIPVADPRDPAQVAGTAEFEAAQAPHAQV